MPGGNSVRVQRPVVSQRVSPAVNRHGAVDGERGARFVVQPAPVNVHIAVQGFSTVVGQRTGGEETCVGGPGVAVAAAGQRLNPDFVRWRAAHV